MSMTRIKHRLRLCLVLLLLLLVSGLLLAPSVRWPIYGWLRGEAFYQGMPTSYWRSEITRLNREPTWAERLLERIGVRRTNSDNDNVTAVATGTHDPDLPWSTWTIPVELLK